MKKLTLLSLLLVSLSLHASTKNETTNGAEVIKEIFENQAKIQLFKNIQDTNNLEFSVVISVTDSKGRPYNLKLEMTVAFHKNVNIDIIKSKKYIFSDKTIFILSARNIEELMTAGGKAILKEDLVDELNQLISKEPLIYDIYFTQFVIVKSD
jgi:flagellar FliL protein